MNTARFANVAKVLALSVALGTGLVVTVFGTETDRPLHAQEASLDTDTAALVKKAVSAFKRGKYEDAATHFNAVMIGMPKSPTEASNYLKGVREAVPNDVQASLNRMRSVKGDESSTTLKNVGVWLVNGRSPSVNSPDKIFGRLHNDPKMANAVKDYMGEEDPLLRAQRGRVIGEKYGEFAVMSLFNDFLAADAVNQTDLARVQALLVEIGSQAALPLVQCMNYMGEDRETVLTPVVRVLGRLGSSAALPTLKEEFENSANSTLFRNSCRQAIVKILDLDPTKDAGEDTRVTADSQTLWYLQANGWYLNDAAGNFGDTYQKIVGTNFAGHLPSVADYYGQMFAVWYYDAEAMSLKKRIVPSWLYADSLAAYAAQKATNLALGRAASRGFDADPTHDPFVLNALALQARIAVHQFTAANGRITRLEGAEGAEAEITLINDVLRDQGGLLRTGHLSGLAQAMGPDVMMNALRMSLEMGYPQVATELCNALLEVESFGRPWETYLPTGMEKGGLELADAEKEEESEAEGEGSESEMENEVEGEGHDNDSDMDDEEDAEEERRVRFLKPLVDAAKSEHEMLAYAGARALVGLGFDLEYGDMASVQVIFAQSIKQSSMKSVLVIASDDDVRMNVRTAIDSKLTLAVASYANVEAGLRQATQSPNYDAIIIMTKDAATAVDVYTPDSRSSSLGNSESTAVDTAYRVLATDVGTKNIPVIYIGQGADLGGISTDDLTIVESSEDKDAIRAGVQGAVGENSGEAASNDYVIRSAAVIQSFDPNDSEFDLNVIAHALAASLGSPDTEDGAVKRSARSTAARIALADAIAHIAQYNDLNDAASAGLINNLNAILNSTDDEMDSAAVRASCCEALGELMRHHQDREAVAALRTDVASALEMAVNLAGSDMDTRNARIAAGRNLGKLNLTTLERNDLFTNNRLGNPKADTPDLPDDVIAGYRYNDAELPTHVKNYMEENDPLLRDRRAAVIGDRYGQFAVMSLFNDYLAALPARLEASDADSMTTLARAQGLLRAIGSESTHPLVQAFEYQGENRESALTPVVRSLGRSGANASLPALKEAYEDTKNSAAFRDLCREAIVSILGITPGPIDGLTADAQSMWYAQANGWYLNDAATNYGSASNPNVRKNFTRDLPNVNDPFGHKNAIWSYDAESKQIQMTIVPSWLYADGLAAYAAEKSTKLARGIFENEETMDTMLAKHNLLNSMSLQARVAVHQFVSADARLARLKSAEGEEGVANEEELINSVMRGEGGLLLTGHLSGLASAMGPEVLMNALRMSLEGGHANVSAELCNALLETKSFGEPWMPYTAPVEADAEMEEEPANGGLKLGGGEDEESEGEAEGDAEGSESEEAEGDNAEGEASEGEESETEEEIMEVVEVDTRVDFLKPLIDAVSNKHEQVRYAAARALVGLGYDLDFANMNAVHSAFATGLKQSSTKNILVIASDENVRTNVRAAINSRLTYNVVTYGNVEDGLRQATQSPIYDAIIIMTADAAMEVKVYTPDAVGGNSVADTAYRVLSQDVGTKDIPRIFIGDASELSGVETGSLTVIESEQAADAIRQSLMRAVGEESGQDSSNAFVISSCDVVTSFNPNDAVMDMNVVARSLANSLGSPDNLGAGSVNASTGRSARSTEARIALADAIAHLAQYEDLTAATGELLIGNLTAILGTTGGEDQKDTAAVRASCCQALGELMRFHQDREGFSGNSERVRSALEKAENLTGSDADTMRCRAMAGSNLGKLKLNANKRVTLFERNRTANYMPNNQSGE